MDELYLQDCKIKESSNFIKALEDSIKDIKDENEKLKETIDAYRDTIGMEFIKKGFDD